MSVTTNNASYITNGISQLHALLKNSFSSSYSTLSIFHVRCSAYVIKFAMEEGMKIVATDMDEVGFTINAMRASSMFRDDFEAVVRELVASCVIPQTVHLPTHGSETC